MHVIAQASLKKRGLRKNERKEKIGKWKKDGGLASPVSRTPITPLAFTAIFIYLFAPTLKQLVWHSQRCAQLKNTHICIFRDRSITFRLHVGGSVLGSKRTIRSSETRTQPLSTSHWGQGSWAMGKWEKDLVQLQLPTCTISDYCRVLNKTGISC